MLKANRKSHEESNNMCNNMRKGAHGLNVTKLSAVKYRNQRACFLPEHSDLVKTQMSLYWGQKLQVVAECNYLGFLVPFSLSKPR